MLQDVSSHRFHILAVINFFLAINKIVQSGSWVGICSAALGGHPDSPNGTDYPFLALLMNVSCWYNEIETESPYNREGSVMIWNDSLQILAGHRRDRDQYSKSYTYCPRSGVTYWRAQVKHYTVNDIKPDPTRYQYIIVGLAQLINLPKVCPLFPLGMIKESEFGSVNQMILLSVQVKNVRLLPTLSL